MTKSRKPTDQEIAEAKKRVAAKLRCAVCGFPPLETTGKCRFVNHKGLIGPESQEFYCEHSYPACQKCGAAK